MVGTAIKIGAGVAVAAMAYLAYRKFLAGDGAVMSGIGYNLGALASTAAIDLANGVLQGSVETVGLAVGIPKTDMNQCQMDTAAGRTWEASFSCPAKDFFGYLWN